MQGESMHVSMTNQQHQRPKCVLFRRETLLAVRSRRNVAEASAAHHVTGTTSSVGPACPASSCSGSHSVVAYAIFKHSITFGV